MEHFKQTYEGENTSVIHLYMPVTQLQRFFSQSYLIYTYIYIAFIIEICKHTHRKQEPAFINPHVQPSLNKTCQQQQLGSAALKAIVTILGPPFWKLTKSEYFWSCFQREKQPNVL